MFAIASCRLLVCGYVPLFLCGHGPRHTPSQTVMNFKRYVIRNGYVLGCGGFFCACLTIGFAQLCGCFAARKEEIRKHCSELGGPQTRTIKHNGRVRNHSLPGLVVSLDLAVLGGQAQNGGEVLL